MSFSLGRKFAPNFKCFSDLMTHSLDEYFVGTYCVPATVLGANSIMRGEMDTGPAVMELRGRGVQSRPGWFGVTIPEVQVGHRGWARAIWNDMWTLR